MDNRTRNTIKLLSATALAFIIITLLLQSSWDFDVEMGKTSTRDVGESMFDDYALGFIFIAFILFSSMLGGIFLAKGKTREIVVVAEHGEEFVEDLKKGPGDRPDGKSGGEAK